MAHRSQLRPSSGFAGAQIGRDRNLVSTLSAELCCHPNAGTVGVQWFDESLPGRLPGGHFALRLCSPLTYKCYARLRRSQKGRKNRGKETGRKTTAVGAEKSDACPTVFTDFHFYVIVC